MNKKELIKKFGLKEFNKCYEETFEEIAEQIAQNLANNPCFFRKTILKIVGKEELLAQVEENLEDN